MGEAGDKVKDSLHNYVIFSKIEISRNVNKFPFLKMMNEKDKSDLLVEVLNILKSNKIDFVSSCDLGYNENKDLFPLFLFLIFENKKMDENIVYLKNEKVVIEINNVNHLNFYIYDFNFEMVHAYKTIDNIEELIGNYFDYYASKDYGFLSPKIKDIGLGLKISSLVHLPGFNFLGSTEKMFNDFNKRGYDINIWKYETDEFNNYYVISSNLGFGVNEKSLLERFGIGIHSIIDIEKKELLKFSEKNKSDIVDTVFRSFGLLKYAYQINFKESIDNFSNILMGIKLGFLKFNLEKNISLFEIFFNFFDSMIIREMRSKTGMDAYRAVVVKRLLSDLGVVNV